MTKKELFTSSGESRGYYSEKNRVNNLTGKEWLFWTRSVITRAYPPNLQHALRNKHGGQKPPDLCADLIRVFTKKGQTVLDPFMGVGGTLLGAALADRKAFGIEVSERWIDIYKEVCRLEHLESMETVHGQAQDILAGLIREPFDMILTDVPYWHMDRARRSKGIYKKYGETSDKKITSSLSVFNRTEYASKAEWLSVMRRVFELAAGLCRQQAYIVTFIGDMYCDNEYHCLSAELAGELRKIDGLVWKANIIWYDVSKKLHLYGYQYSYIPSMIHQNILVFRKE